MKLDSSLGEESEEKKPAAKRKTKAADEKIAGEKVKKTAAAKTEKKSTAGKGKRVIGKWFSSDHRC